MAVPIYFCILLNSFQIASDNEGGNIYCTNANVIMPYDSKKVLWHSKLVQLWTRAKELKTTNTLA
jgi:hypothetical protein